MIDETVFLKEIQSSIDGLRSQIIASQSQLGLLENIMKAAQEGKFQEAQEALQAAAVKEEAVTESVIETQE